MTEFEPQTSGIGNYRSANWARIDCPDFNQCWSADLALTEIHVNLSTLKLYIDTPLLNQVDLYTFIVK